MQKIKPVYFAITIAIVFIASSVFAQSCPMCKESMTAAGAKLSEGFYYSIMSMFLLPISLIGGGTLFVMKNSWKRSHPEAENLSSWQIMKEIVKERQQGKK